MKLWIVGKVTPVPDNKPVPWDFCGVFDDEIVAAEACSTTAHFVGPAILNERLPDELMEWAGSYFPRGESRL